ncbi:beta-galactosidase [Flavobacterium sp. FZUC8N2.13]|uniref:Beta-galactosidase n=1 Tax=Flavobacterium zubiriense TaxID=3138075 RepID=A0ABV4T9A9_9FLAO
MDLYKKLIGFIAVTLAISSVNAQVPKNELLYGVAYYDEYMPYDRLDKDIKMMKDAGINVVRIAESTWSTEEPQDNVFDFSHIDRVLDAMHKAEIKVIIGTPTYAVPAWLVKKYPEILATTQMGKNQYGARQNMDITNQDYLFHAERIIRKIMEHVKEHPAIIGYQVDNETKHYGTAGKNVQAQFVQYMKKKFKTTEAINKAFGLDYWSNRINSWDEFPSMVGTINAGLKSEFSKFQRSLVTDFLSWQAAIVREYKKPEQFVTQNFDFDWRGYSYGIQGDVDHFAAAKAMDIAGVDIYHPTQDYLTGTEISFGGDMARSMKNGQNYLVVETQAQGFPQWVPYSGQLRLQAFSHVASGANMLTYWHWHSIHNSAETYWKGLLSHDFQSNPTYNEAVTIGVDFKKIGSKIASLKKTNEVAVFFSNEAQTAFNIFSFGWGAKEQYNDVLRPMYDALYKMNVGVDFIDPSSLNIEKYKLIIVPALYAAPDSLLQKLNAYVKNGGHIIYTFKSGFSNENVTVRNTIQPGIINEAAGVNYSQFVIPENVSLKDDPFQVGNDKNKIKYWMELLTPTTAKVLAKYDHPQWNNYAAVTQNSYGKGMVTYIGCMPGDSVMEKILEGSLKQAGLWNEDQKIYFPLITKSGINNQGKTIRYFFNYSAQAKTFIYTQGKNGTDLLTSEKVAKNSEINLAPWGMLIIEEN